MNDGFLGRVDRGRALVVLVGLGLVGGLTFLLAAGVTPLYEIGDPLRLVALTFPVVGIVLGAVALYALLRTAESSTRTASASDDGGTDDTPSADAVGEEFAELLERAERHRHSGETTEGAGQIHEMLVDAVQRRVQAREGLDEVGAAETVEAGAWTDDPVAAGFLSSRRRLPVLDRLRGAVDPGRAYRRRLDRTLDAIDRLSRDETGDGAESDDEPDRSGDHAETLFVGELSGGDTESDPGTWGVWLAVLLAGVGIAAGQPLLVVGATLGLLFVAAGALASPPRGTVRITRRVSATSGDPGDSVTVTTAVENVGAEPIVELCVVDDPPLPVRSGSPEGCLSLGPEERESLTYELALRRGEFAFGSVSLRASDLTGLVTDRREVGPADGQTLRCEPAVEQIPLHDTADDYAGTVPADEGGSGIEFYSVREYETGDPVSSIDWRQYAHTRDLATVEFRAERSTRTVCVVDCRDTERAVPTETRLPARDISVAAAGRTVDALLDTGHPTGVVTVEDVSLRQVRPGTGAETRAAVGSLLEAGRNGHEPETRHVRSVTGQPTNTLPGALPGTAQVLLFSSMVDEMPMNLVARLRSHGFAVTVVSPDVTAGVAETAVRLSGLQRDRQLQQVRASGAHVVDWDVGRPLAGVLNEALGVHRA